MAIILLIGLVKEPVYKIINNKVIVSSQYKYELKNNVLIIKAP